MGPVLKVKRLKKSVSPKSTGVSKLKSKWEKPKRAISAQPGIAKIKNVKKRSFDPIKANRGVIVLQNIPHGFYEDEMQKYFGQFGLVTRVRLARSQRTGRSKGFAYIEFKVPEVAQIAAETMNNYIMFKHVLKTAYIPPEKQTHNFFRKDVTYVTDAMGQTSFSSAKTKSIEKEIENINRIPTDEEHAKRLKRTQKTLQKQQKKYGIDLSNIVVSGYSSSGDTSPAATAEPKETKKKVKTTKKVAETKPEPKPKDNKIAAKKDKKKVESDSSSNNGKSLLGELLNKTYDSETSDDDFKIDHSFSASTDDDDSDDPSGDESMSFVDVLASKLKSSYDKNSADSSTMDTSFAESEDDDESESVGDEESEEEEPIVLPQKTNGKKKLNKPVVPNGKPVTSNGTVDPKAKAGLKRKLKDNSESKFTGQVITSSQPQPETQAKKKKQNQNKKKEILSNSEISASEPEVPKATMKKYKQKPSRVEEAASEPTTSPLELLKPPTKQKKSKPAPIVDSTTSLASTTSSSSAPETANKNQKKKKAKQALNAKTTLNSSLTASSESESPKQKNKNKKSKPMTDSVPKPANVKVEKVKQLPKNNNKIAPATVTTTSPSVPENLNKKNKKKKNQPAKDAEMKSNAAPAIQNPKMKTKQKSVAGDEIIASKLAPATIETKRKKIKPVTSSLISENGMAKKSKVKSNLAKQAADSSTLWSTVTETDGDESTKTKPKGKANLKSIVRKNVPKQKSATAKLNDVKKVKQTPNELVQLVSSKVLKQNNQLKSKKKSK